MNAIENQQLFRIADRYDAIIRRVLPNPPIASRKAPVPMVKKKEESEVRLLELRPKTDWLYTVGVGRHAVFQQDLPHGPFDWHIGVRFINKANQGSALAILQNSVAERRRRGSSDFFVVKPGDSLPKGYLWAYLHLFKRYYRKDHSAFPAEAITEDLVWLV